MTNDRLNAIAKAAIDTATEVHEDEPPEVLARIRAAVDLGIQCLVAAIRPSLCPVPEPRTKKPRKVVVTTTPRRKRRA